MDHTYSGLISLGHGTAHDFEIRPQRLLKSLERHFVGAYVERRPSASAQELFDGHVQTNSRVSVLLPDGPVASRGRRAVLGWVFRF